jgi:D-glycero-alpha-D-manno-heptose 1-phosphate guanylyltransferase
MDIKEAIVLAGGLGTRLQNVLPDIPKCMAPVHGKPFLTYVFDYLIDQGVNKVILSVGYRNNQIIKYFGYFYKSLPIEYAIENEPLGTGGAIKHAFNYCKQDNVFVVNGDTYFRPDLMAMEKLHVQSSADVTIAIKHLLETGRYGLVLTNQNGRITDFREKEPASKDGWINGGIYIINRQIIYNFKEQKFSLENDVLKVSCSRLKMHAFKSDAFFMDMGIPEDFEKAQSLISATGEV